MITLITEPNLYYNFGSYLPPSLPGLGSAYIAGALKDNSFKYDLIDFYPIYFRSSTFESVKYIEFLAKKYNNQFINRILTIGGSTALTSLLENIYTWTLKDNFQTIISTHRLRLISETMLNIYNLYSQACHEDIFKDSPFIKTLLNSLKKLNNHYVGISLQDLSNPISSEVVRIIAENGYCVIIGGQFTFLLREQWKVMNIFKYLKADYIVCGYGEDPLIELLKSLPSIKRKSEIKIKYVYSRANIKEGEKVEINYYPSPKSRPEFSDYQLDNYFSPVKILPIQTVRGCYWKKCVYCRKEVFLPNMVNFNTKDIINMMLDWKRNFGVNHFIICDEAHPPAKAKAIAMEILSNKELKNIKLAAAARAEATYDDVLLKLMRRAGYTTIFFGIESGSNKILKKMKKGINVKTVKRILRDASEAGISNLCFYMIGFPGETYKEIKETIKLMEQTKDYVDYFRLNIFILQENSYICEHPDEFGITRIRPNKYQNGCYEFSAKNKLSTEFLKNIKEEIKLKNLTSGRLLLFDPPGDGDELLPLLFIQSSLNTYSNINDEKTYFTT